MSFYKPMSKHLVAVYGSLKKGFGNHRLLSDSIFVGKGESPANYSMISFGSFPGLLSGKDIIDVELYEVDDNTLARLDALEGHPHFYKRNHETFMKEDGEIISAQIYSNIHSTDRYTKYPPILPGKDGKVSWSLSY